MKYIKFVCENGFCGCDEDFYEVFEDSDPDEEIDDTGNEILWNQYDFCYPDSRFVDNYDDEEEIEIYQEGLSYSWCEISKEQFFDEADSIEIKTALEMEAKEKGNT